MSLFDFQSREVVHVKVKLCNGSDSTLYKKFSIDPGITTFEVLQRLLARAFDIKCDFTISYLATDDIGEKVYLSMLSDWDLDAAILSASDPILRLKITLRNFDNGMDKDWDIITRGELPLQTQVGLLARSPSQQQQQQQQVQQKQQSQSQQQQQLQQGGPVTAAGAGQFFSNLGSQVGKSVFFSQMQKAVGNWKLPELGLPGSNASSAAWGPGQQLMQHPHAGSAAPPRAPVSDREFQAHLDSAGRVRDFWALKQAVFMGGLEPSLRKVAWRLLLPVFPKGSTGHERMAFMKRSAQVYSEMKRGWKLAYANGRLGQCQLGLITAISKDVIRTDRGHPFYSGGSGTLAAGASMADPSGAAQEVYSPHVLQLFDLLVTYAIYHPSVGYAQGMSDLASPLLVVQEDESYAYTCFCALMSRVRDNFKRESTAMLTKFQHLHDLVVHLDAELAAFLRCHGLADMFFTHRWLLLELKREFEFSDTLRMLEIQWAALPHRFTFPDSPDGVRLQEADLASATLELDASAAAAASSSGVPQSPKDTPYLRLQSMLRQQSSAAAAAASTGCTPVLLKDGVVELAPPESLGCGNPFLLFMCCSMLLEHRDRVMRSCHDMCEIVMHFNRLIRSHNLQVILNKARQMFTEYMESQDERFAVMAVAATAAAAAAAAASTTNSSK